MSPQRPGTHHSVRARPLRHHCVDGRHLGGELAKEWPLSDSSANASRSKAPSTAPSAVDNAALHKTQQMAERLLHERQAATGQGCCDAPTSLLRGRDVDNNDGTDTDNATAGHGRHAYLVAVRYMV